MKTTGTSLRKVELAGLNSAFIEEVATTFFRFAVGIDFAGTNPKTKFSACREIWAIFFKSGGNPFDMEISEGLHLND